jgi:hypothetical protein
MPIEADDLRWRDYPVARLDFGWYGHTVNSEPTSLTLAEHYTGIGDNMENRSQGDQGIRLMVKKCRSEFERSENKDYYEDYRAAERKFVKFCLLNKTG